MLRAITAQESQKNPWSFNADGESFSFNDKSTAVRALWSLTQAPWMVKSVTASDGVKRRFFKQEADAQYFAQKLASSRSLRHRTDAEKEVLKGQVRVRKIWLINTDIGIAQINYRWHGKGIATVQKWFDPAFNLNYAAAHLAILKKKYGSDLAAAGYYHSATLRHRKKYMADFMPKYYEEKRNASVSMASSL